MDHIQHLCKKDLQEMLVLLAQEHPDIFDKILKDHNNRHTVSCTQVTLEEGYYNVHLCVDLDQAEITQLQSILKDRDLFLPMCEDWMCDLCERFGPIILSKDQVDYDCKVSDNVLEKDHHLSQCLSLKIGGVLESLK